MKKTSKELKQCNTYFMHCCWRCNIFNISCIFLACYRDITEGTGWILDGFPATIGQAKVNLIIWHFSWSFLQNESHAPIYDWFLRLTVSFVARPQFAVDGLLLVSLNTELIFYTISWQTLKSCKSFLTLSF